MNIHSIQYHIVFMFYHYSLSLIEYLRNILENEVVDASSHTTIQYTSYSCHFWWPWYNKVKKNGEYKRYQKHQENGKKLSETAWKSIRMMKWDWLTIIIFLFFEKSKQSRPSISKNEWNQNRQMTDIGKKCKKNRRNQCKIEGKKTDERDKIGKTIGREYRKKWGTIRRI